MNADDLDVFDRRQRIRELLEAARREHERIAAGDDHLPNFAMRADIGDRGIELCAREGVCASNHFAAETKAAIRGTDVDRLEQHPVRGPVHDALYRAMGTVPDRVAHLLRAAVELGLV